MGCRPLIGATYMTALPNPWTDAPSLPVSLFNEADALEAVAAALTGQLTTQQVRWAASHDWFVADLGNGLIQVVDRWVNLRTGERGEDVLVWDKPFAELRDWAGY